MASCDQETQTRQDEVLISKVEYFGTIHGIFEIDYRTFQMYVLDVVWGHSKIEVTHLGHFSALKQLFLVIIALVLYHLEGF